MEHVLEHENANFVTSEKQSFTIRVKATKYRAVFILLFSPYVCGQGHYPYT